MDFSNDLLAKNPRINDCILIAAVSFLFSKALSSRCFFVFTRKTSLSLFIFTAFQNFCYTLFHLFEIVFLETKGTLTVP